MRRDTVRELEDWVQRTFPVQRGVPKAEVLSRAREAGLPAEDLDLLAQLPQTSQTAHELVAEIDRMAAYHEPGGSAGGMDAGSSGEKRPGAYGAPPDQKYGGGEGSSYEP